jgi:hypothetical protein
VTSAALDRLLAVLVVALVATGLVSLRMGAPGDGWLFALHGILGGALAILFSRKVKESLPRAVRARRWRRVVLGFVVSLATAAALAGGFAWVASGRLLSLGSWTILTIHAWIGLALVPLVVMHLLPGRWRLLVPRASRRRDSESARTRPWPTMSRRQAIVGAMLGTASVALFGAAQLADHLTGGTRRFTGSRWLPSGVPPPTTFYGEAGPDVDPVAWRLRVHGNAGREVLLSLDRLEALGEIERTVVLDCTSGWAMAAEWRGVPLRGVLDAAGVTRPRSVLVRSATGWATALGGADIDRAMLATGVAGAPLPAANGAPCRLVIPDRRGLDWVKWVAEIEVVV